MKFESIAQPLLKKDTMSRTYKIEHLHQPDGWLSPGYITIGHDGQIEAIDSELPAGMPVHEELSGYCIPGLPNLHSHAFQRALAGRTECISDGVADTFWTWRTFMYDFVSRLEPHDYAAIGAFVYLEMVKFGMTSVAEFHYVHHDRKGQRYANHAEMSDRLFAAADRAGIAITMLPVLYAHAGIGLPPTEQQRRFVHTDVDDYLKLVNQLKKARHGNPKQAIGMALHSLRAVAPAELRQAVQGVLQMDADTRIHIHVSEQPREVEEVIAGLGARPVEWLLDNVGLDQKWSLIHATHINQYERKGMAASGVVAGICPVTEATLGDGIFPLVEYQQEGGRWGIGTDSHYTTSTAEELRILECGLRLQAGRRNMLVTPENPLTSRSGRRLFDLSLAGGRQSLGMPVGSIAPGQRADLVVLDPDHPTILGHTAETVLDAWILSATGNPVRDVMIAGDWIVRNGQHEQEEAILRDYKETMRRVLAAC